MKSNIQLKSALLVLVFFASMSMVQFSTSGAAVQGTYEWETVTWDTSFSTHAQYSTLGTFQGRDNVLKIQNYAHYANQLTYHHDADNTLSRTEISVDFYPDALGSWSWGPALRVTWDNGAYAWIRAQSSTYGQWRMTGQSGVQQYGAIPHDRWYNFKIVAQQVPPIDGDNTVLSIYMTDINYGSEVLMMSGYVSDAYMHDFTITLGSLPAHDYSSSGSWETFYYDNVRVNGEELSGLSNNPIEWEASPTSDGSDYDTTWQVDQSVQNPYGGIEVVESFNGHDDVLKFDKEANYHARVIKDDISINSDKEFTVFVDYYPEDMEAGSWGPQLRLQWDGGGVAFIRDEYTCTTWGISGSTKQTCSTSVDEAILDGRWYQFRIQVTADTVKLSHADLSQHDVKNIASETGWTQLKVPYGSGGDIWEIPRHSSMTGNFKVLLGTAQDYDYGSTWGRETYYYDNFEILTGSVDSKGSILYRMKDLNADVSTGGIAYTTYQSLHPGTLTLLGLGLRINDEYSSELGDFIAVLGNPYPTKTARYVDDSLSVTKFEIFRPWTVSRSTDWYSHDMKFKESGSSSTSVTHERGFTAGIGSQNEAGVSYTSGESTTKTYTLTAQGLTTYDGAVGIVFIKHVFYKIEGTIKLYTSPTNLFASYYIQTMLLRDLNPMDYKFVQTGIDVPGLTGELETRTRNTISPLTAPFGVAETRGIDYTLTETRSNGIKFNMQLGLGTKSLEFVHPLLKGVGGFASISYSYTDKTTSGHSNAYFQEFVFYGEDPAAPTSGSIYLYDINTWGTIISETPLTEIIP